MCKIDFWVYKNAEQGVGWPMCCEERAQLESAEYVGAVKHLCPAPALAAEFWGGIPPRILYHCLSLKHERKIEVSKPYNKLG